MILLSAENLRKQYGTDPVLDGVTFDVRVGQRIALVGPNGCGKTTLLRILAGREDPDGGSVQRPTRVRTGLLEQQPQFAPHRTVWDEACDALRDLMAMAREAERIAEALSQTDESPQRDRLARRYDDLQQQLHHRDGYNLDHKVHRVLAGLGFPPSAFSQPVSELSGGQQNRLLLARLLLEQPDLLLLDEPSNHLDIDATQWLEDYLVRSDQALIVVSHDRYFLDRVAQRTLELVCGTVESFQGNYSAYQRQKAERLEVQRRTYQKQQDEVAKMEDFVRRHHYGQKHAQAEDRRKKLERMVPVDRPREIVAPPMGFAEAPRSGDVVARAEGLSKAFDRPLFCDVTFQIQRGQRWGILGPNGCGKTTLLRCVLGQCEPDAGSVALGTNVRVGYFDQLLHCLDDDASIVDAVRPDGQLLPEQARRDLLARFGICGDHVFRPVRSLSGGERNRAGLARLAASSANFLVLDEPTNHLDLWARESLERSLRRFNGTVLLVSHDRYFLNRVVDHLLVVEPGGFRTIEGNYETYLQFVRQGLACGDRWQLPSQASETGGKAGGVKKRAGRAGKKTGLERRRRFAYRKVEDIEAEIAQREARIEELHTALASQDIVRNGDRIRQVTAELREQQQALAQLYEHWEEAIDRHS